MRKLRPVLIIIAIIGFTLPIMPVQAVLLMVRSRWSKRLPVWYHRQLCRIVGIRLTVSGTLDTSHPVLLLANHISWLDIPVISTLGPVSFVAKHEIRRWPFVGWLARLQRTVFVNRERRSKIGRTASELVQRLARGDNIVLFPEGTSGDGNHILPFKSSLLAAAKPSRRHGSGNGKDTGDPADVQVQTLALAYTGLGGLPLGRRRRYIVAWYGDMDFATHAWQLLRYGPLDVEVSISDPVPLDQFADRKALTRFAECQVKIALADLLTHRPHNQDKCQPPSEPTGASSHNSQPETAKTGQTQTDQPRTDQTQQAPPTPLTPVS